MRLQAAILDWAGTTVDFGSMAPVRVIQQLFAEHGVPLSGEESRAFMGMPKRDHIAHTLQMPRVRAAWSEVHGEAPGEAAVRLIYDEFEPRQLEVLREPAYSELIPGTAEAVARMRARGMKIGSTTGYTRPMLELILERAKAQGYDPDCALCPGDVGAGRPYPWMVYEAAVRMKVYPLWAMVKIGDTAVDVEEGLNAGMWTVAVIKTGNLIGCAAPGNAHYAVDSVAEIDAVLDRVDARLAAGERP
jgi:phosphonoacetaldehyde hydrolase